MEGHANTRPVSLPDNVDNIDGLARTAYERRIDRLEKEKGELVRKLSETTKTLQDVVRHISYTQRHNTIIVNLIRP